MQPDHDLSSVEAWERACADAQQRANERRLARQRAQARAKYEWGAFLCALAVLVTVAVLAWPR